MNKLALGRLNQNIKKTSDYFEMIFGHSKGSLLQNCKLIAFHHQGIICDSLSIKLYFG